MLVADAVAVDSRDGRAGERMTVRDFFTENFFDLISGIPLTTFLKMRPSSMIL